MAVMCAFITVLGAEPQAKVDKPALASQRVNAVMGRDVSSPVPPPKSVVTYVVLRIMSRKNAYTMDVVVMTPVWIQMH